MSTLEAQLRALCLGQIGRVTLSTGGQGRYYAHAYPTPYATREPEEQNRALAHGIGATLQEAIDALVLALAVRAP